MRNANHKADAAVERTQHFVVRDIASLLEPAEYVGSLPGIEIDAHGQFRAARFGNHARRVFQHATTGDVRHAMHADLGQQLPHSADIQACRCQQLVQQIRTRHRSLSF